VLIRILDRASAIFALLKTICILVVMSLGLYARAHQDFEECSKPLDLFELSKIIDAVRSTYFKQIAKHNIVIEKFNSADSFFQTQPVVSSLFDNLYFRKYKIQYNPQLFSCPPSRKAIVAILVHEFEHINDYFESSAFKLLTFSSKYVISSNFSTKYERATDLKACKKGQAEGLKEYREWLYQQLNEKQIALKRKKYMTPEELENYSSKN
jgi:hypothetical protein